MAKRSKSGDYGDHDETSEARRLRKKLKKENKEKKKIKKKRKREEEGVNNDSSPTAVVQALSETDLPPEEITSHPIVLNNAVSIPLENQEPPNEKEGSPFHYKKARLLVSLLPASLRNIQRALNGAMQALLLRYSDGIGGVLLSFDSIEIEHDSNRTTTGTGSGTSRYGIILDEMPHIHYYITSNILVFRPEIGKTLSGVVNEAFPSHVGILVYGFFNAMVSANSLRANGFSFDSDLNEWSQINTGAVVQVEDTLTCKVDKIHECNGMISLECTEPSVADVDC